MPISIENNKIIISSPSTLEKVGEVKISSIKDVEKKLNIASNYKEWTSLPLSRRCSLINKFRKVVFNNKKLVESIIESETGKKDFVIFAETLSFFDHAKSMSKIARTALKNNKRNSGLLFKNKKAYVKYEPLGVVGIISPWNFSLATAMKGTIEGLLAGNNIVLKPSEYTPLTIEIIKKLWDENIGYNDAFQIVHGDGKVGSILVKSDLTDIISFTGSTKVGLEIAKICSETLKPCILELGGKDPMIVLKDASMKRAVESALYAGLFNAGQTCISTEEVFVENEIFDEFLESLSAKIKSIKSGSTQKDQLGPIITPENKQKINDHLNEIKNKSKVIYGMSGDHDNFIAPAIVVEPPENSRIVNEETFGPVISVRSFKNEDDLINKIHKTGYGLSSSIFSNNKKRINRIISRLKFGNVNINDAMTSYIIPSLPYGGEGKSGLGKQHGIEGLRSYCRVKSILENRFNFIDEPAWWNRPKIIEKLLRKIVNIIFRF